MNKQEIINLAFNKRFDEHAMLTRAKNIIVDKDGWHKGGQAFPTDGGDPVQLYFNLYQFGLPPHIIVDGKFVPFVHKVSNWIRFKKWLKSFLS